MSEPVGTTLPWGQWPQVIGKNDYKALSKACGYLNLSEVSWIRVSGPDAATFLNGILTADFRSLNEGEMTESWALDASGKILHHALGFRKEQDILLQTLATEAPLLLTHLDKYLVMEDAELELLNGLACLSVQGHKSQEFITSSALQKLAISHDRCGYGGFDIVGNTSELESVYAALDGAGISQVGTLALEQARTEAFLPLYTVDMNTGMNPLVYGQGGSRISYTKGCFLGQETVAKSRDRGRPPKLMVQVKSDGTESPDPGTSLMDGDKAVGEISSGQFSPSSEGALAFAVMKFAAAQEGNTFGDEKGRSWTIQRVSQY